MPCFTDDEMKLRKVNCFTYSHKPVRGKSRTSFSILKYKLDSIPTALGLASILEGTMFLCPERLLPKLSLTHFRFRHKKKTEKK